MGLKLLKIRVYLTFLVSRRSRWRPKDSRPSVHASVRMYVTLLLETRSLLFSETLQLVRACKCEKNVPSAFLKKIPVLPILAKNCPKLAILAQNAQKWRFFAYFSESLHYFFSVTLQLVWDPKREKICSKRFLVSRPTGR